VSDKFSEKYPLLAKGYMARKKNLLALGGRPAGRCRARQHQCCVHHVIQEGQRMCKSDGLTDGIVDKLVTSIGDDKLPAMCLIQ
jgi:hypothetical protein